MQDELTLVELGEQHRVEEYGPDAVLRFFETDLLLGQRVGDIQKFGAEPKRAARRDLLDEEMSGVLQRW